MRYITRLPKLVWVLNMGLLTAALSLLAVAVFPRQPAPEAAAARQPPETTGRGAAPDGTQPTPVDAKLILERDIFRVKQAAAAEQKKESSLPPERPKTEPKREVSLRLLGTVVDEAGASLAIIENLVAKTQDVYHVNDSIGGARVARIEQNRVAVLNGGVPQTLELVVTGQTLAGAPAVAQAPASDPLPASSGEMVRTASATERQINTQASAEHRNRATEFLRKLKLSTHETEGRADGLTLAGVGDSALARLSGLQDGDVIQTINGHPVPNETKAAQVLKKARNLGVAHLELQRGSESKSMTFRTDSW